MIPHLFFGLVFLLSSVSGEKVAFRVTSTHDAMSANVLVRFDTKLINEYDLVVYYQEDEGLNYTQSCLFVIPKNTDQIDILCSCFSRYGTYLIVIEKEGNSVVEKRIEVVWPMITLTIPSKSVALSNEVNLGVKYRNPLCPYVNPSAGGSYLTLLHKPDAKTNDSGVFKKAVYAPLHVIELEMTWNSLPDKLNIPCRYFDHSGSYRIQLWVETDSVHPVAESNIMEVKWASYYKLMSRDFIHSCSKGVFTLGIDRPVCKESTSDRIRIYSGSSFLDRAASLFKPHALGYFGERRLNGEQKELIFDCDYLDDARKQFCFELLTVAEDGSVFTHYQHCVPTTKDIVTTNGQWGEWKPWSACSVTCEQGVKHRVRNCDGPPPNEHGKFCAGYSTDTTVCNTDQTCPNATSESPGIPKIVVGNNHSCPCGCILDAPLTTIISNACPVSNSSVWLISTDWNKHLTVKVLLASLDRQLGRMLVREGKESWSGLLLDSYDENIKLSRGFTLWSPKNRLRFEYIRTSDSQTEAVDWEGVVIAVDVASHESYLQYLNIAHQNSIWEWLIPLVIAIVTFTIGCVLVAVWLLFARYTRLRLRLKYNIIMQQSLQTSGGGSIGRLYDPLQVGNRLSSDSEAYNSSALRYEPIKGSGGESSDQDSPRSNSSSSDQSPPTSTPRRKKKLKPKGKSNFGLGKRSEAAINQSKSKSAIESGNAATPNSVTSPRPLHDIPEMPEDGSVAEELSKMLPPANSSARAMNVSKRSIGIQLNSPALMPRRHLSTGSSLTSVANSIATPTPCRLSPSSSFAGTEADFEYDYYEANVPGSFLNSEIPWVDMYDMTTEIIIDDIIAGSELMSKTPVPPLENDETMNDLNSDQDSQPNSAKSTNSISVQALFKNLPSLKNPVKEADTSKTDDSKSENDTYT